MANTQTEARLGPGTIVRGEWTGPEDLVLGGRIEGPVTIDGALVVEESGSIAGDVRASAVTILGTVDGNIVARELIRVRAGARVHGNLVAPKIAIEEGARFAGAVDVQNRARSETPEYETLIPAKELARSTPRVEREPPPPQAVRSVTIEAEPEPVDAEFESDVREARPRESRPLFDGKKRRIVVRKRT